MAVRKIAHPSIDERKAKGLEARDQAPLPGDAGWSPAGTARIRSPCWRSRMPPASRTWCRFVMAG